MNTFFKQKEMIYQFGIWGILIVWYVIFGSQMLHKADVALDDTLKSHSFWLFPPAPKEKDNITIVAIDQESRRRLNLKWPWPRSITAEMIQRIAACDPSTIGLDIVFSGESQRDEDEALIAALQSHPNIIAASMVQTDKIIKPAPQFETALKSTGYVNRPIENGKVRSMIPVIQDADQQRLWPIEFQLLQTYLGIDLNTQIKLSENEVTFGQPIKIKLQNGLVPLNYLVYHNKFNIIPAFKVLENQIDPLDFKDKIVLIGATDPIIHDEYDTVLGVFPGVTIIANALVMLLSQRFITVPPLYLTILIGLICSAIIYLACRGNKILLSTLALLVMMAGTFLAGLFLRGHDIRISCLTLLFTQFVTYLAFNLYHYINLIFVKKKIINRALFDAVSGLYSTHYFKLLVQERAEKSDALDLVGINITNYENLKRKLSVEQIKDLIKNITSELRTELSLSKKDAMASVFPDVIGALKEDPNIDRLSRQLEDFIRCAERKEWSLDDRNVRVSLKGLLLHKAAGEKIESCDPIAQIDRAIKKLDSAQKIYSEPMENFKNSKNIARQSVNNEYDFIVYDWEEKAKDLEESLNALSEANTRLDRLNISIIKTLARSIDAKSSWTAGHSERVTSVAVQLGKLMELDNHELEKLQIGGLLHDIGKIGIPSGILDKPGKLTDEEYDRICEHPAKGVLIIEPLEPLQEVIPLIKQHHERFDGKGYPQGLAGNDIDPGARIMAVADVYDALCSDRPYRPGMPLDKVVAIIKEGSGTQFDPRVVAVCLQFIADQRTTHPKPGRNHYVMNQSHGPAEAMAEPI
jgi:HD-GYP domain-containing protein (c-di-GMP phosphodiesterase class II)/CHASE2 domain-containing sensor protein